MVKFLDNNSGFNQWNMANQSAKQQKKPGFLSWLVMFLLAWWVIGFLFPRKQTTIENAQPVVIEKSTTTVNKIGSDKISADVQGLRVSGIALKDYNKSANNKESVSLLDGENNFIEIGFVSSDTQVPNINTKWNIDSNNSNMVWHNNGKIKFNRNISIENYVIRITDTIKNNSGKEISIAPYVRIIHDGGHILFHALVEYPKSQLVAPGFCFRKMPDQVSPGCFAIFSGQSRIHRRSQHKLRRRTIFPI